MNSENLKAGGSLTLEDDEGSYNSENEEPSKTQFVKKFVIHPDSLSATFVELSRERKIAAAEIALDDCMSEAEIRAAVVEKLPQLKGISFRFLTKSGQGLHFCPCSPDCLHPENTVEWSGANIKRVVRGKKAVFIHRQVNATTNCNVRFTEVIALTDVDKLYLAMAEVGEASHFNTVCYSLGVTSLSKLKDVNSMNSIMLHPKEVDIIKEKVGRGSFRFDQLAQKYKPRKLVEACQISGIPVIQKEAVSVAKIITSGNYVGVVCEAQWTKPDGKKENVCLRYNPSESGRFFHEAVLANRLRHKNIIDFYGVVITSSYSPSVAIVEEISEYGNLDESYAHHSVERLCRFTIQAATALEYLETKKAVHQSLWLHCMVVADYQMKLTGIGYCAFESAVVNYPSRFFSLKQVVYTFAKVFSGAFISYQWRAPGHEDVAKNVMKTSKLVDSAHGYLCPSHFCDVFDKCLQDKAEERPSFSEIRQLLQAQQHHLKVKVTRSFSAQSAGFLSCNAGELITVISKDLHSADGDAWFGETQRKEVGFFRSEHVEEVLDCNIMHELPLPPEIRARGPAAERAFQKAMQNGKVKVYRGRIMLLGQDRAGKTSLKKSLLGMPFNPLEESTVGVEVNPSKCELQVDQVKNWERTERKKLEVSEFAEDIARLIAKDMIESDADETESDILTRGTQVEQSQTHSVEVDTGSRENFEAATVVTEPIPGTDQKDKFVALDVNNSYMLENNKETDQENQLHIDTSEALTDDVMDLVVRYLKNLKLENNVKEKEVILTFWDFAGQHLYYASHSVFLSKRAVYLLVYNLSKNLIAEAKPSVRQGIRDIVLDNSCNETNLDNLLSWLVSIHSIQATGADASGDLKKLDAKLPYLRPPVFIVGTNADHPFEATKEMEKCIKNSISGKTYEEHVIRPFFAVDNTKGQNDEGVQQLQRKIMEVLTQEPYMGEEVPLRWFSFEKVVEALVAKKTYHMDLDQLLAVIRQVCRIDDVDEVTTMLNFYHDLGVIVKHGHTVVLQAQWLIDLFKQLITVRPFDEVDPLYSKSWQELEERGILRMALVDYIFEDFTDKGLCKEDILGMMELYGLIVKFSCLPFENEKGHRYFVPAQLRSSPAGLCELKPAESDPCPLYVHFLDGFVPHGLFPQILSRCIGWCSEHGLKQAPQLFNNGARFFIGKQVIFDLILFCRKAFVKVMLKRRSPALLEPHLTAATNEMAVEVRIFIETTLKSLSRDLSWLHNLRYEISVVCTYCFSSSEPCSKHSSVRCFHDDCLHLLPLHPGEELICPKSFSDGTVKVPGLEKWFEVKKSKIEEQRVSLVEPLKRNEWDQAVPLKMSTPSRDDILLLAHELGTSWKMIGRVLGVSDAVLEQIEDDEPKLFDKCYSVLRKWKQAFGSAATYQCLARALKHPVVGRSSLAVKYCGVHACEDTGEGE